VAVKGYNKNGMNTSELDHLREEVDVHRALSHSNLVELVTVYESEDEVHIVLEELTGGSLLDHIRKKRRLSESEAAGILAQTLSVLAHLHSHNVAHRDIKPENLIFSCKRSHDLKLIDLGFAAEVGDGLTYTCGSLGYVAPEVLSGYSYDERCDIWSTGSLLYLLLTGRHLIRGDGAYEKTKYFTESQFGNEFGNLSLQAQDFLRALLETDPDNRLSAREALEHPWFSFVKAEEQRLVALALEEHPAPDIQEKAVKQAAASSPDKARKIVGSEGSSSSRRRSVDVATYAVAGGMIGGNTGPGILSLFAQWQLA